MVATSAVSPIVVTKFTTIIPPALGDLGDIDGMVGRRSLRHRPLSDGAAASAGVVTLSLKSHSTKEAR